eukprot:scaffold19800_cov58-Cyclotella_meneghiniana.AAC.3
MCRWRMLAAVCPLRHVPSFGGIMLREGKERLRLADEEWSESSLATRNVDCQGFRRWRRIRLERMKWAGELD